MHYSYGDIIAKFHNRISYITGQQRVTTSSDTEYLITGQQRVITTTSSDTDDTLGKSQENISQPEKDITLQEDITSKIKDLTREATPSYLDTKLDTVNMAGKTTDDPNTEGTQSDQALDPNGNNQNNNSQNVVNDQIIDPNINNTVNNDANSNQLANATTSDSVIQNQEVAEDNSPDSKRKSTKPIPAERLSKCKSKSQIPQTAPKELYASKVDFEKPRMVSAAAEIALPPKSKNQPTLMMIRKRESVTQADMVRINQLYST